MTQESAELEAKLLEILDQPDLANRMADAAEKVVADEEEQLSEEQRETLATLLEAGLPTPQDIMVRAECAEHNAKVAAKRAEKLRRRRERRAASGQKPKKPRIG